MLQNANKAMPTFSESRLSFRMKGVDPLNFKLYPIISQTL